MPSTEELFSQAEAYLKTGVTIVQKMFTKPEDDWHSFATLIGETKDGMMPLDFTNDEEKQIAAEAIAHAARTLDAKVVTLVMSAWQVTVNKDEVDDLTVRPSEDPRREEILILTVVSAQKQVSYTAPIKRDGVTPPTLGQWKKYGPNSPFTGRFVDPVVKELVLMEREKGKKLDG